MDLSGTGLSSRIIYELGKCLRRSRAIVCIHLSGNPGTSDENRLYLNERIHCRKNEDMTRFTRICTAIKGVMKNQPKNVLDGIKVKIQRDIDFRVRRNLHDPILNNHNDKLIF